VWREIKGPGQRKQGRSGEVLCCAFFLVREIQDRLAGFTAGLNSRTLSWWDESRGRGIPQGLKPSFCLSESAKAEALAYLDAKTRE
jgi:hypothetical protein